MQAQWADLLADYSHSSVFMFILTDRQELCFCVGRFDLFREPQLMVSRDCRRSSFVKGRVGLLTFILQYYTPTERQIEDFNGEPLGRVRRLKSASVEEVLGDSILPL